MRGYLKWIALLALLAAAAWFLPPPGANEKAGATAGGQAVGKRESVLIEAVMSLPDEGWEGLAREKVEIEAGPNPADRAAAVLRRILSAPESPLPDGTKIQSVFVYDDVAVVSLSGDFREKLHAGPWRELLVVYSLVNTLTESLEEVGKVKILIDGREAEVFASHVDVTSEIAPDTSFTLEKEAPGA